MKIKLLFIISILFFSYYTKAQTITELGFFAPLINSSDVKYINNHVVVAQQGLKIFSIANPANPVQVGSTAYPGSGNSPHQLAVQDNYAYLAEGGSGYFSIYNISNPSAPALQGSTTIPSSAFITGGDLIVKGSTAYMTGADSLYVVDVTVPTAPVNVNTLQVVNLPPFGTASSLAIDGNTLFVLHSLGIGVYDITIAASPVLLTTIPNAYAYLNGLATDTIGHRLFSPWVDALQPHLGFNVYDISSPATPVFLFSDSIAPGAGDFGNCDYYNNLFVMSRGGNVQMFNVSPLTHGFITSFSGQNVANSSISVEFRDSVFINGKRGGFEVLEYNGSFPVSLNENNLANTFTVYPIPFADYLAIQIPEDFTNKKIQFELYSVTSQVIKSIEFVNTGTINLSDLAPSIYFYNLISNKQVLAKGKIVKE